MSVKPAAVTVVAKKPTRAAAKRKPEPAAATSESINDQVTAFLASGGEIQSIPTGTSGQTYGSPRAAKPVVKAQKA
ncbi:MAG: hypothetical protein WC953_07015 [Pseudomonas sp.]